MAATPIRSVRVDDVLWTDVTNAARERGETVTDVVTRALTDYVQSSPSYGDVLRIIAQRIETETNGRLSPSVLDTAGVVIVGTASGHLAIYGLAGETRSDAFDVNVYEDRGENPVRFEECHSIDAVVRFVRDVTNI